MDQLSPPPYDESYHRELMLTRALGHNMRPGLIAYCLKINLALLGFTIVILSSDRDVDVVGCWMSSGYQNIVVSIGTIVAVSYCQVQSRTFVRSFLFALS
jgi:hypothetical protein